MGWVWGEGWPEQGAAFRSFPSLVSVALTQHRPHNPVPLSSALSSVLSPVCEMIGRLSWVLSPCLPRAGLGGTSRLGPRGRAWQFTWPTDPSAPPPPPRPIGAL